jgi:hypothetical protein
MASATNVTAGLLSKSDYDAFNTKQDGLTAGSGISISGGTISATGLTTSNLSSSAGITNAQLAGSIAASKLVGTDIATVGTITSGTWNGSVIGSNVGGAGTVSGLMKANGSGVVSAAVAGTDYQLPISAGTGVTISTNVVSIGQTVTTTATPTFAGQTLTGTLTATTANFSGNITASSLSVTNNETVGGTLGVTGATTLTGAATISNTTTSSSTTTGALVVRGGVGIAGNLTVGGTIEIDGGSPAAGKVLTSDANGIASWQNSGGSIVTMSATGTATSTASYIIFTGSTASQTITIPSAVTLGAGREITIKNVASVSVSIASAGGFLIQDNSTLTSIGAALGIEPSNNWMKLVSDGTNWYIFRALF